MTTGRGHNLRDAAIEIARLAMVHGYVQRGRCLRDVKIGALKEQWAEIVRQLALDPFNGEMLARFEDVDSELRLRWEAPPAESVTGASEAAAHKLIAELVLVLHDDPARAKEIAELLHELEARVPWRGLTSDS